MGKIAEIELPILAMQAVDASPAKRMEKVRRFRASGLFGNARELVIEHAGDEYRLRITHSGKLILTK